MYAWEDSTKLDKQLGFIDPWRAILSIAMKLLV